MSDFDFGDLELDGDSAGGAAQEEETGLDSFAPDSSGDSAAGGDGLGEFDLGDLGEGDQGEDDNLFGELDEIGTKLDLAKAYVDMGDADGARSILEEVLADGDDTQKGQAQELMKQIA